MSHDQISVETRRGVEKLLQFSGQVGGLTEDDVLAVLRESGITSLESLVRHALAVPPAPQPEPLDSLRLLAPGVEPGLAAANGQSVPLKHRSPGVAVIVDGVEYDPADITRFDGQVLTFVVDGSPDRILAYTDDRPLLAAVWAAGLLGRLSTAAGPRDDSLAADTRPRTFGEVQMFEHHFFAGDWFWLPANYGWPDLTRIRHGAWPGSDWNDTISSVARTDCLMGYFEHINFGGIKLIVPAGFELADLGTWGWNDRISSVANYGVVRSGR
ncbi:hypothetical protein LDL08_36180 [Nonomuraea glycinis]|uniref:Uncharacterized protein n=1 Tax=Nonomuraea glycinis TaxID=2047744 RepID=A0A918E8M8_9ACTN|nr:hypothetical protein [Nonomuraea glycinis]MCA2181613.1 hypothetical protein [Nonomuraea glycinis]GGP15069.1 hypothetical protein GCM10012278_73350 [Nonomuraea glycinis]